MENLLDHRVITTGRGEVRVTADEATVNIQFLAEGKRREPVVRAVSEEAARLKPKLDEIGYRRLETGGTSVQVLRDQNAKKYAWHQGPIIGYRATQTFVLTEGDFDRLEKVLETIEGWEPREDVDVQVSPAQWAMKFAGDRAASAEACSRAFLDARQRAEAVAKAGGFHLSATPAFVRQGGQISTGGETFMAPLAVGHRAFAASAAPPVTISAREIQISAEVTAGWEIEKGA